jgi:hypothetical protein
MRSSSLGFVSRVACRYGPQRRVSSAPTGDRRLRGSEAMHKILACMLLCLLVTDCAMLDRVAWEPGYRVRSARARHVTAERRKALASETPSHPPTKRNDIAVSGKTVASGGTATTSESVPGRSSSASTQNPAAGASTTPNSPNKRPNGTSTTPPPLNMPL